MHAAARAPRMGGLRIQATTRDKTGLRKHHKHLPRVAASYHTDDSTSCDNFASITLLQRCAQLGHSFREVACVTIEPIPEDRAACAHLGPDPLWLQQHALKRAKAKKRWRGRTLCRPWRGLNMSGRGNFSDNGNDAIRWALCPGKLPLLWLQAWFRSRTGAGHPAIRASMQENACVLLV